MTYTVVIEPRAARDIRLAAASISAEELPKPPSR
jgi:hypothetical protein